MEHNKLCRATTGPINQLPRLATHAEVAFVHRKVSFMYRKKRAWYLVNMHNFFAQAGHWFALWAFCWKLSDQLWRHWANYPF